MTRAETVADDLPEPLPQGERILWRGKPDWRVLARRAFHIRKLALYFGVIIAYMGADAAVRGEAASTAFPLLCATGLAAAALGLVAAYAWGVARVTAYTVTDRRVLIRIGIALPMTINLPFARIDGAGMTEHADGAGDIPLALRKGDRVAYLVLWPHARPWHMARPQPMLRGLTDVAPAAQVLARALAASASTAVPVLHHDAMHDKTGAASTPQSALPA